MARSRMKNEPSRPTQWFVVFLDDYETSGLEDARRRPTKREALEYAWHLASKRRGEVAVVELLPDGSERAVVIEGVFKNKAGDLDVYAHDYERDERPGVLDNLGGKLKSLFGIPDEAERKIDRLELFGERFDTEDDPPPFPDEEDELDGDEEE
jgi:hypothetical protein